MFFLESIYGRFRACLRFIEGLFRVGFGFLAGFRLGFFRVSLSVSFGVWLGVLLEFLWWII